MGKPCCTSESDAITLHKEGQSPIYTARNRQGKPHHSRHNYWKRAASRARRHHERRETAMLTADYHLATDLRKDIYQNTDIMDEAIIADEVYSAYLECEDIADDWQDVYGEIYDTGTEWLSDDEYEAWLDTL